MLRPTGNKQHATEGTGKPKRRRTGLLKPVIIILIIALLPCMSFSLAETPQMSASTTTNWTWQNPLPTGSTLNGVCAVDRNTIWTVGSLGTILKSKDGGNTWAKQVSGTKKTLSAVAAIDANNAWAVGQDGTILKTADGGGSWTVLAPVTAESYENIEIVNQNVMWITGSNNTLLKTVNGEPAGPRKPP